MKTEKSVEPQLVAEETIAHFGRVQLLRKPDGRHELTGGSPSEQTSTRTWCQSFAPFVRLEPGLESTGSIDHDRLRIEKLQRERSGFEGPLLQACEALWFLTCPRGYN